MTLAEMKSLVMGHWMENYPKTAKQQPVEWLKAQAEAQAKMMLAELAALYMPGFNSEAEVMTEVSKTMLKRPPVMAPE